MGRGGQGVLNTIKLMFYPQVILMGKNPGIIIKEQRALAREAYNRAESAGIPNDEILIDARNRFNCTCGYYADLLRAFMIEGYTVARADKHIKEWVENDLLFVTFLNGYKVVGYGGY